MAFIAALSLGITTSAQSNSEVPLGWEIVEDTLRFSPDNLRAAYVVQRDGLYLPVIDHEMWKGKGYHRFAPPVFDPYGDQVFFRVAERKRNGNEIWMLLCDGKKINEGGWIGPVAVSPTGVPAYWVFEDSRSLGGCQLYFGKKKTSKWVNGDTDAPPTLLDGGRLAASVAGRGGAWSIVTLSDKGRKERGKLPGVYMLIPARGADEVLYTGIKNLDRPESAPVDFYLQRY